MGQKASKGSEGQTATGEGATSALTENTQQPVAQQGGEIEPSHSTEGGRQRGDGVVIGQTAAQGTRQHTSNYRDNPVYEPEGQRLPPMAGKPPLGGENLQSSSIAPPLNEGGQQLTDKARPQNGATDAPTKTVKVTGLPGTPVKDEVKAATSPEKINDETAPESLSAEPQKGQHLHMMYSSYLGDEEMDRIEHPDSHPGPEQSVVTLPVTYESEKHEPREPPATGQMTPLSKIQSTHEEIENSGKAPGAEKNASSRGLEGPLPSVEKDPDSKKTLQQVAEKLPGEATAAPKGLVEVPSAVNVEFTPQTMEPGNEPVATEAASEPGLAAGAAAASGAAAGAAGAVAGQQGLRSNKAEAKKAAKEAEKRRIQEEKQKAKEAKQKAKEDKQKAKEEEKQKRKQEKEAAKQQKGSGLLSCFGASAAAGSTAAAGTADAATGASAAAPQTTGEAVPTGGSGGEIAAGVIGGAAVGGVAGAAAGYGVASAGQDKGTKDLAEAPGTPPRSEAEASEQSPAVATPSPSAKPPKRTKSGRVDYSAIQMAKTPLTHPQHKGYNASTGLYDTPDNTTLDAQGKKYSPMRSNHSKLQVSVDYVKQASLQRKASMDRTPLNEKSSNAPLYTPGKEGAANFRPLYSSISSKWRLPAAP